MKTGLITFFHIHHYGAFLQAYATQTAVESLGSECEILNYYVNQNNDLFRLSPTAGAALSDAHTALHYKALKSRYLRFEDFSRRYLHVGARQYKNREELQQEPPTYDVCLSGSDQIWNPTIFPDGRFDPVYFGALTSGRRVAYAPSFGVPRIPDGMEEELCGYLNEFSAISVRERNGRDIIKSLTGRDVPVVLDPTLLLNQTDWSTLAVEPPMKRGSYILCYCISKPEALTPYIQKLSARTGLPVVQLCGIRRKVTPKAVCVFDAGPAEFLGWFRGAAYVCTNSFHGTVFSVQFQKPFFTMVAPSEVSNPQRSRTFNLLSTLGLTNRIIGKGDTADLNASIDYDAVDRRLTEARDLSKTYLQEALMGQEPVVVEEATVCELPHLAARMDCTGCSACASICPKDAIAMTRDKEGFLYPNVNHEKCVQCGKCTSICPALQEQEQKRLPAVFAAWNKNDVIRKDSSSGGVFSVLAEDTIEAGGVVFGAAMDSAMHLRHIACFDKSELWKLRGAKYVQSEIGDAYQNVKEALKTRPVLFSGTPCQVDGLYHYLGERPENLTTCDLVCHGVPSPGVWEDLVQFITAKKKKTIQHVRFRNKVTGWKNSHLTLLYQDGSVDSAPLYKTEFGRGFGRSLFLRPCCYRCPYTSLSRVGDFTIGDFWGLRPDELPDQQIKGVSLLMINTPHASYVFDRLPLSRVAFSPERAVTGNPRLASPTILPPERAAFFAAYTLEPFSQVRKEFLKLPPLPYRMAAQILSPEIKAAIKKKMK